MSNLTKYVEKQLERGYNSKSIENALLSEGYAQDEINNAFKKTGKTQKLFAYLIVTVATLILIIIALVILHMENAPGNNFSMILKIKNSSSSLHKDEKLVFNLELHANENNNRIVIGYNITKFDSENTILSKKFQLYVKKNKSVSEEIDLKDFPSGKYTLNIEAFLNNIKRKSYLNFYVIESEQSKINKSATDAPKINSSFLMNRSLDYNKVWDSKEQCLKQDDANKKEACLELVAKKTNDSSTCLKIDSAGARDGCLAYLALEGNWGSCEKIWDDYQRNACFSIRKIKTET